MRLRATVGTTLPTGIPFINDTGIYSYTGEFCEELLTKNVYLHYNTKAQGR